MQLQYADSLNREMIEVDEVTRDASALDNLFTAFKAENLAVMGINAISDWKESKSFKSDPLFDIKKQEDLLRNLSPEARARVGEAESEEEFNAKYTREIENMRDMQALDESSASFVHRLVAGVVDPTNALYFLKAMNTGSKLVRGLKGAALEGSAEAARWKLTEFDDRSAATVGAVLALGGAFNMIGRGFDDDAFLGIKEQTTGMLDNMYNGSKIEAGLEVSPETLQNMKWTTDSFVDDTGIPEALKPKKEAKETTEAYQNRLTEFVNKTDMSMAGLAKRSNSPTLRQLSDKIFSYHYGKQNTGSTQDVFSYMHSSLMNKYNADMKPIMNEYVHGSAEPSLWTTFWNPKVHEFNQTVGEAIYKHKELKEPLESFDPIIQKAIKVHTQTMDNAYDMAKANGHPSFQHFEKRDDYFHNAYSPEKLTNLDIKYGRKELNVGLTKLFSTAIKKSLTASGREINDSLTEDVVRGMVNKIIKAKVTKEKATEVVGLGREELASILTKHNVKKEDIEAIQDVIKGRLSKVKGTEAAVKHKTPMDRRVTVDMPDGSKLGFLDITDTSLDSAVEGYIHKTSGRTALHSQGFNDETIAKYLDDIEKELEATPGISPEKRKAEYARAKTAFDYFRGFPTTPKGSETSNRLATMANSLTVAKYLGQTAFTMAAEAASITHRMGIRELGRQIPAFKAVWDMYIKGNVTNPVYKDLYDVGLAGDILQLGSHSRFDADASIGFTNNLMKGESYAMAAREAVLHMGGIKPLTTAFDLMYGAGSIRKLTGVAQKIKKGKKLSTSQLDDLDALGLTEAEVGQLTKYINDNGSLLLKDVKDATLYNKVVLGIRRDVDRTVQKSDLSGTFGARVGLLGGDEVFSQTPIGKLVLNLKSYSIGAYSKQLGYMASRRDAMLYTNTMAQLALGAIAYIAQQALNSGGNRDYFNDRTEPEEVLFKSLARTTTASYLPGMADLLSAATTGKTIFSGSGSYSPLQGVVPPAYAVAEDAFKAVQGTFGLIDGVDDKDVSKISKILPNLVIFNSVKNGILKD